MLGGMLAGHDQSGGDVIEKNGKKYKMFYGMSSATAMRRYSGGVAEYRYEKKYLTGLVMNSFCFSASEGKTVELEYRGDVHATILDVLGGIRSTCTYVGAQKLKEISKRTTFIRVTQQTNDVYR